MGLADLPKTQRESLVCMNLLICKSRLAHLSKMAVMLEMTVIDNMEELWTRCMMPATPGFPGPESPLSELDGLKDRLDELDDRDPKSDEDVFALMAGMDMRETLDLYPFAIRSSTFTTAYYTLENRLVRMCSSLHDFAGVEDDPSSTHGTGLKKVQNYFKNAGLDFPDQGNPNWEKVSQYRHIRNLIAHNGGFVDKAWGGKVEPFINRTESLGIDPETNRLELSLDFLWESTRVMSSFAQDVLDCLTQEIEGLQELMSDMNAESASSESESAP